MKPKPHPLELRRDSAQAALDHGRNRPLRFGDHDCARVIAAHLRRLGIPVRVPPKGSYRNAQGALRKLRQLGFAELGAAIDALGLETIPPAAALVGDVIELDGEDGTLSALTIALGNGRVAGFYGDGSSGLVVLQPIAFRRAWRAEPRRKR